MSLSSSRPLPKRDSNFFTAGGGPERCPVHMASCRWRTQQNRPLIYLTRNNQCNCACCTTKLLLKENFSKSSNFVTARPKNEAIGNQKYLMNYQSIGHKTTKILVSKPSIKLLITCNASVYSQNGQRKDRQHVHYLVHPSGTLPVEYLTSVPKHSQK